MLPLWSFLLFKCVKRGVRTMTDKNGDPKTAVQKQSEREYLQTLAKAREDLIFDIPGVTKIVLSPTVQKNVGCVVGENVTEEKPWTYIRKELLKEKLDKSALTQFKDAILEFPQNDLLFGYNPNKSDADEFYFCHTEDAHEIISKRITEVQNVRQKMLLAVINKTPKPWKTQGSEADVEDLIEKTSRPLYKVEITSEYPIMKNAVKFSVRKVEDVHDGYREIVFLPPLPDVVNKRRIDTCIQASSDTQPRFAQTICTYPRCSWTQYEYNPMKDTEISEDHYNTLSAFLTKIYDDIVEKFNINKHINFYVNDYDVLVVDKKATAPQIKPKCEELMPLIDVNICKSKMISAAIWKSNFLVISYCNISTSIFVDNYEDTTTVYDTNPVLLWREDNLNPDLLLETNKEIKTLSFCPYNPHLIIGGCGNGQIVVWDTSVEPHGHKNTKITLLQKIHNATLKDSFAKWSNKNETQTLRIVAISDLKFSHSEPVSSIEWLPIDLNMSKTGHINKSSDKLLQFATTSTDNSILFWSLNQSEVLPEILFENYSGRLKTYPQALIGSVSKFADNLERVYKVQLNTIAVTSFSLSFKEEVVEKDPHMYIVEERTKTIIRGTFFIGTVFGEYVTGTWKGMEDVDLMEDVEEEVSFEEEAQILSVSKYHDGPILSVSFSKSLNSFLSVGGHVFAIWRLDLTKKPIFWRKCENNYTSGSWNNVINTIIELTRMDGTLEKWMLLERSDIYVDAQKISGFNLTGYYTQIDNKERTVGIADSNGFFRILKMPLEHQFTSTSDVAKLNELLQREIEKKVLYEKWQKDWCEKYVEKPPDVAITKRPKPIFKKSAEAKSKHRPSREELERKRLGQVLLDKKGLNKAIALELQLPLVKQKEAEIHKQQKLKEIHRNPYKLFKNSVSVLFPEVVREKPPPQVEPYKTTYKTSEKLDCYKNFCDVAKIIKNQIEENPFSGTVNYNQVLLKGRECRAQLENEKINLLHRKRHEDYKYERKRAAEEAEKAKLLAKAAAELVKHSKRATRRVSKKPKPKSEGKNEE